MRSCLGGIRPALCAAQQIYRPTLVRLSCRISATSAFSNTATSRQARAASHIHSPESPPARMPPHVLPRIPLTSSCSITSVLKVPSMRQVRSDNKPVVHGALTVNRVNQFRRAGEHPTAQALSGDVADEYRSNALGILRSRQRETCARPTPNCWAMSLFCIPFAASNTMLALCASLMLDTLPNLTSLKKRSW